MGSMIAQEPPLASRGFAAGLSALRQGLGFAGNDFWTIMRKTL
jgi:hypothetical protein